MIGAALPGRILADAQAAPLPYIGEMKAIALLFALLAYACPALADEIPLKDISAYLNHLTTAETDFTQVNADGSKTLGRIFIARPGRVRFEYAPPDKSLVLASSGVVAIFDGKSNEQPVQYPLKRTPLNLILAQNIDLSQAKMVVGHHQENNITHVVAQDPAHPEYGSIDLMFTANPIALRQWVIQDDLGQNTTVILGNLVTGAAYNASMFSIPFEKTQRGL